MKTNKMRRVIALLATLTLIATMVIVPMTVNAGLTPQEQKGYAANGFQTFVTAGKSDTSDEAITTAKPGETVYLHFGIKAPMYTGWTLQVPMNVMPTTNSKLSTINSDRYAKTRKTDTKTFEFTSQKNTIVTEDDEEAFLEKYPKFDELEEYALGDGTYLMEPEVAESIYVAELVIPTDAVNDPVTGRYEFIDRSRMADMDHYVSFMNSPQDYLDKKEALALQSPYGVQLAGVTLVDDYGYPVNDEKSNAAVYDAAEETQTLAPAEALAMDDGTYSMRFFFKAQKDGVAHGAYILPFELFTGIDVTVDDPDVASDKKAVFVNNEESIAAGDLFAAQLNKIPVDKNDMRFVAIGFVKGSDDAFDYYLNIDESNTVDDVNLVNYVD